MPVPDTIASFEELVQLLEAHKVPHFVSQEARLVELPSNVPPLPKNLYVKWEKAVPYVQFVHFMIEDVPDDRLRDLEVAMARINHLLAIGGFGFAYDHRRLYYRLTATIFPGQTFAATVFNDLGRNTIAKAAEFVEAFRAIVAGEPGEKVIDIQKANHQARLAASKAGGEPGK